MCGCERVERSPVIHHFLCAYVGPGYDFMRKADEYFCPKCRLAIDKCGGDSEVIGYSLSCNDCGAEWVEEDVSCESS